MDTQQKKIIDFINQLYTTMKTGKGKEEIGKALKALASYTFSHFAQEEKMLQSIGYPQLSEHKAIHTKLIQQVTQLITRHDNGKVLPVIEVMNFLKNCLVDHIMKEDMQYSKVEQPA